MKDSIALNLKKLFYLNNIMAPFHPYALAKPAERRKGGKGRKEDQDKYYFYKPKKIRTSTNFLSRNHSYQLNYRLY